MPESGLILAIDPGPERSGYVYGNPLNPVAPVKKHEHVNNHELLAMIGLGDFTPSQYVTIEEFQSWGRRLGGDSLLTVFWSGRFAEAASQYFGREAVLIPRRAVCKHVTGDQNCGDGGLRAALIETFGPGKSRAIGTKVLGYGPLHGLLSHEYAALALAVMCAETR